MLNCAPVIIQSLNALIGINDPSIKLQPAGMLAMLLQTTDLSKITVSRVDGGKKTIKVRYPSRRCEDAVSETESCDINFTPSWKEADLGAGNFVQDSFYLSVEDMRCFMEEALKTVQIGKPATGVIKEVADTIARMANALVQRMDKKVISQVVWGNNVAYTPVNNAAKTLNISKDQTKLALDAGIARLLFDLKENGLQGNELPLIVGSGLFAQYEMLKASGAIGTAQNGIDISKANGYKFYYDRNTAAGWAANQIGVFMPGAVHFVDVNKNIGFMPYKHGTSVYFQITLPVATETGTVDMTFDVQIKEIDCPTPMLDGYGVESTYSTGWAVYIRKNYGLFQLPSDAYDECDVLSGVNGALRYNVTNVCEEC